MLRNISAAVVAAGALTLGGCNELTPAQIAAIQTDAVAICGFFPTAGQVGSEIAGAPQIVALGGAAVAKFICSTVTAHGGRLGAQLAGGTRSYTVTFRGTPVTFSGHFVTAPHAVRRHR